MKPKIQIVKDGVVVAEVNTIKEVEKWCKKHNDYHIKAIKGNLIWDEGQWVPRLFE